MDDFTDFRNISVEEILEDEYSDGESEFNLCSLCLKNNYIGICAKCAGSWCRSCEIKILKRKCLKERGLCFCDIRYLNLPTTRANCHHCKIKCVKQISKDPSYYLNKLPPDHIALIVKEL